VCDSPQHSDSEGVSPGDQHSLQPAVSSSTLGSDSPVHEEEDEEELCGRKDSLEHLLCSGVEEEEEAGQLNEFLLEDEQVEDFATSVLAAISCWQYTVFLSSAGTVRRSAAGRGFIATAPPLTR